MTVQHSSLSLSGIGYHLYTIFLFIQNDIPTAIIPVVGMADTSLSRCSRLILPGAIFCRLGTVVQSHIYLSYYLVDFAPYAAVQPSEPDQGARGRQVEQTIKATSGRENYRTQRDDPPVADRPIMFGILIALWHPIGVCQSRDAVVHVLVQRDGRR